jgi:hypothetical protein
LSTSARLAPTSRLNSVDLPTLGRPTRTTVKGMAQAAGEDHDAATRMRRAGSGLPLYHEAVSGKTWPAPVGLAS